MLLCDLSCQLPVNIGGVQAGLINDPMLCRPSLQLVIVPADVQAVRPVSGVVFSPATSAVYLKGRVQRRVCRAPDGLAQEVGAV